MSCWVERYVARVQAAKAHLAAQGVHATRNDLRDPVASWTVGGFWGHFSNEDLVALAERRGFDAQAIAA